MELSVLARHRTDDIVRMNAAIAGFFADGGCCFGLGEQLLREAKLDWQVQLSRTLYQWLEPGTEQDADARLILAWGQPRRSHGRNHEVVPLHLSPPL